MRKKITLTFTAILLFAFSACVAVDPQGRGYTFTVPMGLINSTLAEQFPVETKQSLGTVHISDPSILGQQGKDKLSVGTAFNFTNFLIPKGIGGNLKLASGVRFDPNTKNLYLADPMVEELTFKDFSLAKYLTDDMKKSLGLIIAETIAKKPIYNIKKAGVGSNFVKAIDVNNGEVVLTFGL